MAYVPDYKASYSHLGPGYLRRHDPVIHIGPLLQKPHLPPPPTPKTARRQANDLTTWGKRSDLQRGNRAGASSPQEAEQAEKGYDR
jgi:hypothetical protein